MGSPGGPSASQKARPSARQPSSTALQPSLWAKQCIEPGLFPAPTLNSLIQIVQNNSWRVEIERERGRGHLEVPPPRINLGLQRGNFRRQRLSKRIGSRANPGEALCRAKAVSRSKVMKFVNWRVERRPGEGSPGGASPESRPAERQPSPTPRARARFWH